MDADYVELIQATSISRRVKAGWDEIVSGSRVVGVFDRACSLLSPDGLAVSLVLQEIGDGPLSIVIRGSRGVFKQVKLGQCVTGNRNALAVGKINVAVHQARTWEPRPDWDTIRQYKDLPGSLTRLRNSALRQAPNTGLLALFHDITVRGQLSRAVPDAITERARQGAMYLTTGWSRDQRRLRRGAGRLAGLGEGLTPAGDDFMSGAMLWAWLSHRNPQEVCRFILEEAKPRTTKLSAAFLEAAADGECNATWHELLQALVVDDEQHIEGATQRVLDTGNTSGADTLAGFLWMGQMADMT